MQQVLGLMLVYRAW